MAYHQSAPFLAIRKDPPITADENNRRFENILQLMVNTCDDGSAPLIRENGKPWSTWRLHQHLCYWVKRYPGDRGTQQFEDLVISVLERFAYSTSRSHYLGDY